MHINRSLKHHRVTGTKSRIIAKVHNLLGQPTYESMTKMFEQFNKLHVFAYWEIKHTLLLLADFFSKSTSICKNYFRNTTRVSNSLDPDQM